MRPTACKGASTNNKRPLSREDGQKSLVCSIKDLVAEEIMDIVLLDAVHMSRIRRNRMHSQSPVDVVDDVRRVINIASSRSDCRGEVGLSSRWCRSFGGYRSLRC